MPHSYLFTGKERDSESGLDNFGARYDASRRVDHPFRPYPNVRAPPFALFEGWATLLVAPTIFNFAGQSFIFTASASAQAYHRKLLQAHSSGALTNPRIAGLRCM